MLTLNPPVPDQWAERELDGDQAAVVSHRGHVLRVLGGPGTGKTTTAVALVVDRVRRGEASADQCLVLTHSRQGAARLRSEVTRQVASTSTEPLARTHQSFGFGILRVRAALAGDPPPRLLSGPEQDVIVGDLLRGHALEGGGPQWPRSCVDALGTRGFRQELRDLLMRAAEHKLDPEDLARLGHDHGCPEWVAGADVLAEYDEVTALSSPGAYDPAWLLDAAATVLREDEEVAAAVVDPLRLVVVDDAQELTPGGLDLLVALTDRNPALSVVLIGDPDAATQTFRGGDPRLLAREWSRLGDGPTLLLRQGHRLPEGLTEVAARVSAHIGAVGEVSFRGFDAAPGPGLVEVHQLRAVSQEATFAAATLRRAHLRDGMPWSQMAVIARGRSRTATLRRALTAAGVPVGTDAAETPVRDEPAVAPLLMLLALACSCASGQTSAPTPVEAVDLLTSVVGGADPVLLRRLRRALRQAELSLGGHRSSDELLAEALVTPTLLTDIGPEALPAVRIARMLAAGVTSLSSSPEGKATAEDVLWDIWSAAGLAGPWRESALAGGAAGIRADRDLDAVLALFDAAARFTDRLPAASAEQFLEHITSRDVPGDTLAARAREGEVVELLTPQTAAGREWDLVVVAGVQEGVWPDTRLRGSLLRSAELVDVVTGRGGGYRAAAAAVRHDETRLFLVATTRARHRLVVTAVRSEDEQPSPYLDLVLPLPPGVEAREFTTPKRPMTLPSLVGELRREVAGADPQRRGEAVTALARLAREGVAGADPATWWALADISDGRPRRQPDQAVDVRPSAVESFADCGLRWFLSASGGDGPKIGAANLGTLIHEIADEHPDTAPAQDLLTALDAKWPRLGLRAGWAADQQRSLGEEMVQRLSAYWQAQNRAGWTRLASEVSVRAQLGRARVSARLDRLELGPEGELRVIDYKTGGTAYPSKDLDRHPQLGVYQAAVAHGVVADSAGSALGVPQGPPAAGAALVQLGKAARTKTSVQAKVQEQKSVAADREPGWVEDKLATTADGMSAASFLVQPAEGTCRICPVRSSCPAQSEGRWI